MLPLLTCLQTRWETTVVFSWLSFGRFYLVNSDDYYWSALSSPLSVIGLGILDFFHQITFSHDLFLQLRMHLCWGSWYGPHHRHIPVEKILKVESDIYLLLKYYTDFSRLWCLPDLTLCCLSLPTLAMHIRWTLLKSWKIKYPRTRCELPPKTSFW